MQRRFSMEKENNRKEMAILIGYKSRTGILFYVMIFGMLLSIISFLCPFCSYNPTVIDEFKQTVGIFELSPLFSIIFLLFWAAALMLCMFCVSSLAKPDWRERAKKYSVYPILSIIFVLISIIFIAVACVFYEIPEQDFSYLETQTEAGFYLFVIGNVIFSVAFLIFSLALKNLAAGKISMEDITLFKEKSAKETRQTENALLSDKLKELHDLRNSGLITEQEFDDKKEELLKNYK